MDRSPQTYTDVARPSSDSLTSAALTAAAIGGLAILGLTAAGVAVAAYALTREERELSSPRSRLLGHALIGGDPSARFSQFHAPAGFAAPASWAPPPSAGPATVATVRYPGNLSPTRVSATASSEPMPATTKASPLPFVGMTSWKHKPLPTGARGNAYLEDQWRRGNNIEREDTGWAVVGRPGATDAHRMLQGAAEDIRRMRMLGTSDPQLDAADLTFRLLDNAITDGKLSPSGAPNPYQLLTQSGSLEGFYVEDNPVRAAQAWVDQLKREHRFPADVDAEVARYTRERVLEKTAPATLVTTRPSTMPQW